LELTPEEKAKIYAEEKARIEAQQRVQQEQKAKTRKQNRQGCLIGFSIIVVVILIIVFSTDWDSSDSSSPNSSSTVDLKASVSFTGTQFVITNGDVFDYRNATMTVNKKYKLKGYTLSAGEVYTVGMMQFADKDGNRFTALMKPQSFSISCDVGGKSGYYYGTWE